MYLPIQVHEWVKFLQYSLQQEYYLAFLLLTRVTCLIRQLP